MSVTRGLRFEADSLMTAAEQRILRFECALSEREQPWDGETQLLICFCLYLLRAGHGSCV